MSAAGHERTLDGKTILVVDDDDDVRMMIATVLRTAGADVVEAGSALRARERLDTTHVDAALVDWHLGDGDGGDLLDVLLTDAPDLAARTAVVTGDVLESTGSEIHGHPVLLKPFRPKQLIELVETLLTRSARGA